jgi:cellobiose phosphorylase
MSQVYNIKNSAGLTLTVYDNGSIKNIIQDSVQIKLLAGSPFQAKGTNLYLRIRGKEILSIPLFGPESPARQVLNENVFQSEGQFQGVRFSCRLMLAEDESSWVWNVQVQNNTTGKVQLDLLYTQDVGMVPAETGSVNDLFVSQYVDYEPLLHDRYGHIICCRQVEQGGNCIPWLALGSLSKVKSYSTDGLQFFGPSFRETGVSVGLSLSQLQGRAQQEFSLVALQEEPFVLEPGQSKDVGFFAVYCSDHPQRTTPEDTAVVESRLKALEKLTERPWSKEFTGHKPAGNLFSLSSPLIAKDLTEDELNMLFSADRRHEEVVDGNLLSFFYGNSRHVVTRRKELLVDRPHAHIIKTGTNLARTWFPIWKPCLQQCLCSVFSILT